MARVLYRMWASGLQQLRNIARTVRHRKVGHTTCMLADQGACSWCCISNIPVSNGNAYMATPWSLMGHQYTPRGRPRVLSAHSLWLWSHPRAVSSMLRVRMCLLPISARCVEDEGEAASWGNLRVPAPITAAVCWLIFRTVTPHTIKKQRRRCPEQVHVMFSTRESACGAPCCCYRGKATSSWRERECSMTRTILRPAIYL
jgi:hypothetical protein